MFEVVCLLAYKLENWKDKRTKKSSSVGEGHIIWVTYCHTLGRSHVLLMASSAHNFLSDSISEDDWIALQNLLDILLSRK